MEFQKTLAGTLKMNRSGDLYGTTRSEGVEYTNGDKIIMVNVDFEFLGNNDGVNPIYELQLFGYIDSAVDKTETLINYDTSVNDHTQSRNLTMFVPAGSKYSVELLQTFGSITIGAWYETEIYTE